jgi:hypothetical protein
MPETIVAPTIAVEISPGGLIDKITTLEIKPKRIADAAQLENVLFELGLPRAARSGRLVESDALFGSKLVEEKSHREY